MTPAIPDTAARQYTGGPSPVPGRGGNRNNRARKPGLSDIEAEIAGLLDRSAQELRLAWRKLHRTEPPLGISRDLLMRSLACQSALNFDPRSACNIDPGGGSSMESIGGTRASWSDRRESDVAMRGG